LINVLIVDDSALVREILSDGLSKDGRINVVGIAGDPYAAREIIAKKRVDVMTLDIEMPRMDGLTFMNYLMKYHPIPVIVVSSLVDKSNEASIRALELGAVDVVAKPDGSLSVQGIIENLVEKIISGSYIDFDKHKKIIHENHRTNERKDPRKLLSTIKATNKIIAVGASTGGTQALEVLFKGCKPDFPPIVAVIHMPEKFTYSFAKRLNEICRINVKEAENNERLTGGTVYMAPGNYHMTIKNSGKDSIIKIMPGPRVNHQRPAVDILFNSVAENAGKNSIGILLTGMGNDGAAGLLNIRNNGGYTIAQDEETSIVWGMPKEAIGLGAVDDVMPLYDIAGRLIQKLA
jgi:two-component system, chemotaxis family, protein-glutamate methylesterase/glutaminase